MLHVACIHACTFCIDKGHVGMLHVSFIVYRMHTDKWTLPAVWLCSKPMKLKFAAHVLTGPTRNMKMKHSKIDFHFQLSWMHLFHSFMFHSSRFT